MTIILIAVVGFIGSAILNGYAGASKHDLLSRLLLWVASALVIVTCFLMATKIALNRKVRKRELWMGAAVSTVGLFLLQNAGKYLLSHELKNLTTLYGAFAAVLGFFFLIYIQSQIIVYAMEINSVHRLKLWPRKLVGDESK
jgi:uncharacterized BrkB/YihY/UPF0761 family membrane protein